MFDDLKLKLCHCELNSFESLPENILGSFTILAHLITCGLTGSLTTEILKKKRVNQPLRKQSIIFQIHCLKIFSATKKVITWPVIEHQLLV